MIYQSNGLMIIIGMIILLIILILISSIVYLVLYIKNEKMKSEIIDIVDDIQSLVEGGSDVDK